MLEDFLIFQNVKGEIFQRNERQDEGLADVEHKKAVREILQRNRALCFALISCNKEKTGLRERQSLVGRPLGDIRENNFREDNNREVKTAK